MKLKKCKHCKEAFEPSKPMQSACSPKCAYAYTIEQNRKKFNQETKERRKKLKEKDRDHWVKAAQDEFNRFIRLRDKNEPCISCGRYDHEIKDAYIGGKWDCGHFLSRGAFPELRFEELNAHKQCKSCNGGSGKYARKARTVVQNYEIRLTQKIGQDKVDWLKGPHEPKKYTIEELKEIREFYKQEIKRLEAENETRS